MMAGIISLLIISFCALVAIGWGVYKLGEGQPSGLSAGNVPKNGAAFWIGLAFIAAILLSLSVLFLLLNPNFVSSQSISWLPHVIMLGVLIFIVILMPFPNLTGRCPHCHKFGVREDSPEEMVGIFRQRVEGGRYEKDGLYLHEKYHVYHRCKACGRQWRSTRIRRL